MPSRQWQHGERNMCMICVEFFHQRMTREELKKAIPEMVRFAKSEEERAHYKKLEHSESSDELATVVDEYMNTHSPSLKKSLKR